ncbi:MAG TPA: hypothetical protein VF553_20085 [Pyrinomonadaceae bacterium]
MVITGASACAAGRNTFVSTSSEEDLTTGAPQRRQNRCLGKSAAPQSLQYCSIVYPHTSVTLSDPTAL